MPQVHNSHKSIDPNNLEHHLALSDTAGCPPAAASSDKGDSASQSSHSSNEAQTESSCQADANPSLPAEGDANGNNSEKVDESEPCLERHRQPRFTFTWLKNPMLRHLDLGLLQESGDVARSLPTLDVSSTIS
jgi:hypothetical protein